MNNITIIGRLTRDPESRTTNGGTSVASFSVAVNRDRKGDGSDKDNTDFFNVKAFGKTADYIANYGGKGRLVSVQGRMECSKYEKQGAKVERWEIVADRVSLLDRPREDAPQGTSRATPSTASDDYDPFGDE